LDRTELSTKTSNEVVPNPFCRWGKLKTRITDQKLRFAVLDLPTQQEVSLGKAGDPLVRLTLERLDRLKAMQSGDPLRKDEGRYLARTIRSLFRARRNVDRRESVRIARGKSATAAEKQDGT
jgi:hypothetical protein